MNRMRIHGAQFGLGLLLALTLWTYVSFTTNPNTPKQIVVNVATGRPQSFSASTTLSIVGPKQEIQTLTPQDFPTTAHLENAKPGVNRVPITVEQKPRSVQIQSEMPDALIVG